jgi:ubiquinone/menaquinone biosynthesis C-methylase UbiE
MGAHSHPFAGQRRFYEAAYGADAPAVREPWWFRALRALELHRSDAVASLLPGSQGALLDVGCGSGDLLLRCSERFDRVYGVDVAYTQVALARERAHARGANNVTVAVTNADVGLPFPDAAFDVLTSIAVLAMLFDPYAVVAEMRRVLREGGTLVLQVPNLAYLPRRLALLGGRLPRVSRGYGWDGGHLHNFTLGALRDLLQARGFRVERVTGSGIAAPLRAWNPSLLCGDLIVVATRR